MTSKIILILLATLGCTKAMGQEVTMALQPEEPSFLPGTTVNITKAPRYSPKTDVIDLFDQTGYYPYKGHDCGDVSMAFDEGKDGKQYGSLEFAKINIKITQYGPKGKQLFDQLKPYEVYKQQLKEFANSSKAEPNKEGKVKTVLTTPVKDGTMVLVADLYECGEGNYKNYTITNFRSVGMVGTTIVHITGTYYNDDKRIAEKIHGEVIEKINSAKY